MYDFAELEAVYENIVSTEKSLAEFSHYAIYELEGGFYVWNECKEKILQGIAAAKDFFAQNCSRKQKPYGRTAANCEKLGFGINCRLFEKKRLIKAIGRFFCAFVQGKILFDAFV